MKRIIWAFVLGAITMLAIDYAAACWAGNHAVVIPKLVTPPPPEITSYATIQDRLDELELRIFVLELVNEPPNTFSDWRNKIDGGAVPLKYEKI